MGSRSSFSPSDQSSSEELAGLEDTVTKMTRTINDSLQRLRRRLLCCPFTSLHFFPEFLIPNHLKLPKFDIYEGFGCPVSHIFTYTSDLVQAGATEEALIRLFCKSLQGPALQWLLTIDHCFSTSWVDWARLFVGRYYHNLDANADRAWHRNTAIDFEDLCFFPGFRLPQHFRIPKLSKYNGQGCPITHLFVYCRDLRFLGADDETLVSLFYKSLSGKALGWFLSLHRSFWLPWTDLSHLFLGRFRDNIDAGMVRQGGFMLVEYAIEFEKFGPLSDFRLPKMFKLPKFQKYDGRGCPITHLFVYHQQLHQLGDKDEPLVYMFYKSLTGLALRWFVSLDHGFLSSWDCLVELFIQRFVSNSDAIVVGSWNMISFYNLHLFSNFQLPDRLGVLEFEKYDGNGCPMTHMFAYGEDLRQLGASNEALLFLFYKSLAGLALAWFVSMADSFLTSWELVVEFFIDKFSFKTDPIVKWKWYEFPSADVRLFPEFHLPDEFKVPRFEKYNGRGCPVAHLFAYCQELHQRGVDEKALVCLFYKSLTGTALTWFVSLDMWQLTSWENLSGLFMERYSPNIDPFLMEKWRDMQMQGVARYEDWCFFPKFRLSNDFKVPKFKKYSGDGCPIDHLCVYRRQLHGLGLDEETLIYLFPKSLTGPAFRWFVSQNYCSLKSWEKLATLFSISYCHVINDEPKKVELMALRKGDDESFSDYVCRWRSQAARIIYNMNLEEQIEMVKQSALPEFSGYQMPFHFTEFPKLKQEGSGIKDGIKNKITEPWASTSGAKNENSDEKKDGVGGENAATPSFLKDSSLPPTVSCGSPPIVLQGTVAKYPRRQKGFTPIGQSYGSILALLMEKGLLTPLQPAPLNPQSKSYDANAHCAYHQAPGHSTENCFKLKRAVQDLIDKGKIVITPPKKSKNTSENPKHKARP